MVQQSAVDQRDVELEYGGSIPDQTGISVSWGTDEGGDGGVDVGGTTTLQIVDPDKHFAPPGAPAGPRGDFLARRARDGFGRAATVCIGAVLPCAASALRRRTRRQATADNSSAVLFDNVHIDAPARGAGAGGAAGLVIAVDAVPPAAWRTAARVPARLGNI